MNILHLNSGIFGDQSVSTQLSNKVIARLQQETPQATVVARDLASNPIAHLDAEILMAAGTEAAERNVRQQEELALTETLLEELFAADLVVIGTPMYNFSIPSQLKAWIDRIAQAGKTFRYTESGAEGLLTGKRAIVASARGGFYSGGEAVAMDHQESYLQNVLAFVGITDVTVVRAEGLNINATQREESIQSASSSIDTLAAG